MALISLAESLYFDLNPKNIKIQIMCPGFVDTEATAVNDFDIPTAERAKAADHIISGMQTNVFLHDFPKSFTRKLQFLRYLPDRLYLRLSANKPGLDHNLNPNLMWHRLFEKENIMPRSKHPADLYREAFAKLTPTNLINYAQWSAIRSIFPTL